MSKKRFKQIIVLVVIGGLCLYLKDNIKYLFDAVGLVLIVAMPFIIGFCIAFLINKPYMFFSDKLLKGMVDSKFNMVKKARKPISLVLAYLIVFGIVAFLIVIIIPQLVVSFNKLATNFASYADEFKLWLINVCDQYLHIELKEDNDLFSIVNSLVKIITGGELRAFVSKIANTFGPDIFNVAVQVTTNVYNVVMGIVISFYFLACKDKLIYQTKKFTVAVLPEKLLPKVFEVAELTNHKFGRFIYGRIIDSLIMGMLCFIGMSIFRFDYAMLISVIIGVTNIIPMFGPVIGAVPSIIILLIVNPVEAFWFTVFILILQQIDGNLIGPKVMGSSIGLSGFWIMASVILGGGLFGVVGMFVAVPLFAVIYVMMGNFVNKRLKEKDYLQSLGETPTTDILNNSGKEPINFKNTKLYKTIKDNVKINSKKNGRKDNDSHNHD